MLRYYDERAPEYEEAYVLGTGTASMADPEIFRREAMLLAGIVERFARGRLVDLACGTAYWLPHYAARCPSVTLIDQSPRMLDECRAKIAKLDAADRVSMVQGDVLEHPFGPGAFDSALVGFLISHLTEEQEQRLFERLREMLDAGARFLILDSAWSSERARVNAKVERQERRLNDGSLFQVYKRYLDRRDIHEWATKHRVATSIEHFGAAFVAVSGRFQSRSVDGHRVGIFASF
jgi:demethylmenaquinone methyltransferase/2-methoxy-6-polyprenyl-1,4-benzoquinol methylase